MKINMFWVACVSLGFLCLACSGHGTSSYDGPTEPVATAQVSYELIATGQVESSDLTVAAPDQLFIEQEGLYFSQQTVRESAALANFVLGLKAASGAYFADLITHCEQEVEQQEIVCPNNIDAYDMTCDEWIDQQTEHERLVCLGNEEIAPDIAAGVGAMEGVVQFLQSENQALGGGVLSGEIELAQSIAGNMAEGGAAAPYRDWGMGAVPHAMDCDAGMTSGGGGGLGATPGGAQDIGYIRTVVEEGYVPLPFHLAVEGLFSEHNLPLQSTEPCNQLLCVRAALGVAPALDSGAQAYFVQVGFSSGLDAATFERAPLNLAIVLDKSGSMSDMASSELTKMEAVKAALSKMVDKLGPNDRLSIVLFSNNDYVLLKSTPVNNPALIKSLIAGIAPDGGTNIEAGLKKGYKIVAENSNPEQRLDRVMLLTDALPNVGRTGEDNFLTMAQHYAEQGIGLTTFGVGFNFGQELALAISQIRGGNYFFLKDADRINEVFELDFEYLVTPLAYDLRLQFQPAPGFQTAEVYGIPTWTAGHDVVELDVATLFLSRNHGAIVIRLEPVGTPL